MRIAAFALLVALLGLALSPAGATMPRTMNYQGVLKDAGGSPVPDGNYSLTFRIYSASSGGTALWTEAQTLAVQDGILNAVLGNMTALTLPFDVPYWLGIAVGAGSDVRKSVVL